MDPNDPNAEMRAMAEALANPQAFRARYGSAAAPLDERSARIKQQLALAQALASQQQAKRNEGGGAALGALAHALRGLRGGMIEQSAGEDHRALLGDQESANVGGLRLRADQDQAKHRQDLESDAAKLGPQLKLATEKAAADKAKQGADAAEGLRKEFLGNPVVKTMQEVAASYQKIKSAAAKPSAAGDISLLIGYMKMLDPGSTVREGEFATAQNATGVPGQVINIYNKMLSGERLAPDQRADFLGQTEGLYMSHMDRFKPFAEAMGGVADRAGVSREDVLLDLGFAQPTKTKASKQTPAEAPSDTVMVTPPGGGASVPVHKSKLQDAIKAGGKVVGG